MSLENIFVIKNEEINELKPDAALKLHVWKDVAAFTKAIEQNPGFQQNSLLIASTDKTIALGRRLGIATMAYANPLFPNQTYSGVEMIVEGFEEVDADFLEKVYQRWRHLPWTILETERCVVRELTLQDLDGLFVLYADKEMCQFTEPLFPYEEEKEYQRAYINNMYRYFGYGMWLVFLKETGELIGRAGLEHREIQGKTELELGYLIGTPYQGKGYAREVCEAILDYAKEHTGFEQINCVIQEENRVSVSLAEKLGFSHIESYDMDGKVMQRFIRLL